jgi:hypothetical protein
MKTMIDQAKDVLTYVHPTVLTEKYGPEYAQSIFIRKRYICILIGFLAWLWTKDIFSAGSAFAVAALVLGWSRNHEFVLKQTEEKEGVE